MKCNCKCISIAAFIFRSTHSTHTHILTLQLYLSSINIFSSSFKLDRCFSILSPTYALGVFPFSVLSVLYSTIFYSIQTFTYRKIYRKIEVATHFRALGCECTYYMQPDNYEPGKTDTCMCVLLFIYYCYESAQQQIKHIYFIRVSSTVLFCSFIVFFFFSPALHIYNLFYVCFFVFSLSLSYTHSAFMFYFFVCWLFLLLLLLLLSRIFPPPLFSYKCICEKALWHTSA